MNRYVKSFWLLPLGGLSFSLLPSCTTDSYGNSSVTPGGAAAIGVGALAAGALIGAAVQHDRDKSERRDDWHHYSGHSHYSEQSHHSHYSQRSPDSLRSQHSQHSHSEYSAHSHSRSKSRTRW